MVASALLVALVLCALAISGAAQAAAFTADEPLASDTGQVLVEWSGFGSLFGQD